MIREIVEGLGLASGSNYSYLSGNKDNRPTGILVHTKSERGSIKIASEVEKRGLKSEIRDGKKQIEIYASHYSDEEKSYLSNIIAGDELDKLIKKIEILN